MSSTTSKTKKEKKSLKADTDKVVNKATNEKQIASNEPAVKNNLEAKDKTISLILNNETPKDGNSAEIESTIEKIEKIKKKFTQRIPSYRTKAKDFAVNNKKVVFDMLAELVNSYKPKSITQISNLLKDRGYDFSEHRIRNLLRNSNIHKIYDERGERYYKVLNEKTFTNKDNLIYNFIASMNHNNAMIVIKTTIAGAPLVAKLIDFNSHKLDVLGTIAGDDTVLIIPNDVSECEATFDKIYDFLMK